MRCALVTLVVLGACRDTPGVGDVKDDTPTDDTVDTDVTADTGDTASDDTDVAPPLGCRGTPRPASAERAVVVGFPYDADGDRGLVWEVMSLDEDGALSRPGRRFELGRAPWGEVTFTADGSLGVVAQEDGSLGIFTLDDDGVPTVVDAAWSGDVDGEFYAGSLVFDDDGSRAWVVDGNWANNGGGIYEVAFDCVTGAPSLVGQVIDSKLAEGLHRLPDGRVVIVAHEVGEETDGEVFVLSGWPDAPVVDGSATLFDYDDFFFGSTTITPNGRYLLVGENSEFSGVDNRVVWASLDGTAPVAADDAVLVLDPFDLIVSPWGNAALVASFYDDALLALAIDGSADPVVSLVGELDYDGGRPQLPASLVQVARGPQKGLVLVSENTGVRRVRFDATGAVTDLGRFDLGEGLDDIPGAIGLQP